MAALYNLVRVSTATTGTGTITLGSAISGFLTFAGAGVPNGATVSYGISDGANSEVGTGVYTSSGTTLTRTPITSTNSNAAISLSGSAQVFVTALAADFFNGAWPTYTPALSAAGGSFTTTSSAGSYKLVDKTLLLRVEATITTAGTASGALTITLPPGLSARYDSPLVAREYTATGTLVNATVFAGGGVVSITNMANTSGVIANGTRFVATGAFEVN